MNFLWIFCFALIVSCALSVETQPSSDRPQRRTYQSNMRARKSISFSFSHGRGFGWRPAFGGYGYGYPGWGWGR